jgi:hypothetical protein
MRSLLSAAALAALAAPARARKFTGQLGGSNVFPVIGRFSFGVDASSAPVGTATLTYTLPGGAAPAAPTTVYLYDDTIWGNVPQQGCVAATSAQNVGLTGFATMGPLVPAQTPIVETFVEAARPHVWYFAAAADCVSAPQASSYTLDLRLADGSQLGYDELGMPAIYGCFLAINLALLAAHVFGHHFRHRFVGGYDAAGAAPPVVPALARWYSASLALFCFSAFLHMIDWAQAAADGVGAPAAGFVADFVRIGSQMAFWVLCALAAIGYGVVTYRVDEKNGNWVGALLLTGVLVSYLAIFSVIVADAAQIATATAPAGAWWPGFALLGLTLGFAAWWVWKIRATQAAEVNTSKKALLYRLTWGLALNFAVLPVAFLVGAAVPPYERTRVATGFDLFMISAINCVVVYVLWPSVAGDAFRVIDGSSAIAMLAMGGDAGAGGDFAADMSNAYDYTAVSTGAPVDKPAAAWTGSL